MCDKSHWCESICLSVHFSTVDAPCSLLDSLKLSKFLLLLLLLLFFLLNDSQPLHPSPWYIVIGGRALGEDADALCGGGVADGALRLS